MDGFVGHKGGEFEANGLDQAAWGWVRDRLYYHKGDFADPADLPGA